MLYAIEAAFRCGVADQAECSRPTLSLKLASVPLPKSLAHPLRSYGGYRQRPRPLSVGAAIGRSLALQVRQDLVDHRRFPDAGDHPDRTAADFAGVFVYIEYPLEPVRPVNRRRSSICCLRFVVPLIYPATPGSPAARST